MAILALSGTTSSETPPIASKAQTWASIQSGSACVQLALAKVKLDASWRSKRGHRRIAEPDWAGVHREVKHHADFAGQPIDDDRDAIAGVINEQPLSSGVGPPQLLEMMVRAGPSLRPGSAHGNRLSRHNREGAG